MLSAMSFACAAEFAVRLVVLGTAEVVSAAVPAVVLGRAPRFDETVFRPSVAFAFGVVLVDLTSEDAMERGAAPSPSPMLKVTAAAALPSTASLLLMWLCLVLPPVRSLALLLAMLLLGATGSSYLRLSSLSSAAVARWSAAASPLRRILPCTSADWRVWRAEPLSSLWLLTGAVSLRCSGNLGLANACAIGHAARRWRASSLSLASPPFEQYAHVMRAVGWLVGAASGWSSPCRSASACCGSSSPASAQATAWRSKSVTRMYWRQLCRVEGRSE